MQTYCKAAQQLQGRKDRRSEAAPVHPYRGVTYGNVRGSEALVVSSHNVISLSFWNVPFEIAPTLHMTGCPPLHKALASLMCTRQMVV